ncbi:putative ribose/galactose/methyl galactoside import ATP-binding protein 2 [Mesorhizobium plurifarium]|jgi:ABC-type sugar transport system ATPase subunit|uniref:Putative ribose/galactose/methyl galactoside import ATP-binding protein 2 n=2 Tax=Mesorhizobium TaxID=68287 RepID=A0A0K2VPU8_MESPL|nr:putative ribose/galactose/methyl galactoside import ATP-binding protein 2 [Mesorhizobium plurifarium]
MLLEMTDIRKSFAGSTVLHGVSFNLAKGEIHALVGHNGAGKSTLMKVLGGLYADHSGTITIAGEPVILATPRDAHAHGVATIYQDFALVPDFTVAENIALGREPRGAAAGLVSHSALRKRSAQEAAALGIELPMDTPVRRLGVAAQQLTEIVRALSQNASILIMDEPTARLAPAERAHLFSLMRRMTAKGMGIIYISHFLDEVIEIADRITVLRDGKVAETGPSSDFSVDRLAALLVGEAKVASSPSAPAPTQLEAVRLTLENFSVSGRRPFSLKVRAGEIVGLAGLIGSGRSRIARALIGDVESSGILKVDGKILPSLDPVSAGRRGLVLVPEDRNSNGLVLTGSVRANIELTALAPLMSSFGIVRRGLRRRIVEQAIQRFRVRPAEPERNVATLSGGNAQKVLLARAATAEPRILVLDQPTAGVDVGAKAELHQQIRSLAEAGAAVLLISDDLDEILTLSDLVAVVQAGTVTEITDKRDLDRARLLAMISRSAEATSRTTAVH